MPQNNIFRDDYSLSNNGQYGTDCLCVWVSVSLRVKTASKAEIEMFI